jgi:hypothetical protein
MYPSVEMRQGRKRDKLNFACKFPVHAQLSHVLSHPVGMNKKAKRCKKSAEQELKVQATIEGVRLGTYQNLMQATKALGIPRSTVYH